MNGPVSSDKLQTLHLQFDDNALLPQLFGSHNAHLARIEQKLDVILDSRGNAVTISGPVDSISTARDVLNGLYDRLKRGNEIEYDDVDGALRMAANGIAGAANFGDIERLTIHTRKKQITPRSLQQAIYVESIDTHDLIFGVGPAGTGKTYLAVAKAVEQLIRGHIDRIILSRPAVEAGEQLGFLPGDMRDKVDPYLRPLYDALHDMLPSNQVAKKIENGEIEIAPLAFMRGRTLSDAFVILDEAQNATSVQMKMFLTRLGGNARMVVTGDLSQIDLPGGARSGLSDAISRLSDVEGVALLNFSADDVVRHSLVSRIIRAYDRTDRSLSGNGQNNRTKGDPADDGTVKAGT